MCRLARTAIAIIVNVGFPIGFIIPNPHASSSYSSCPDGAVPESLPSPRAPCSEDDPRYGRSGSSWVARGRGGVAETMSSDEELRNGPIFQSATTDSDGRRSLQHPLYGAVPLVRAEGALTREPT